MTEFLDNLALFFIATGGLLALFAIGCIIEAALMGTMVIQGGNLVRRGNVFRWIRKGCGKREYKSAAKAKKAARRASVGLDYYHCDRCGNFHLTSK